MHRGLHCSVHCGFLLYNTKYRCINNPCIKYHSVKISVFHCIQSRMPTPQKPQKSQLKTYPLWISNSNFAARRRCRACVRQRDDTLHPFAHLFWRRRPAREISAPTACGVPRPSHSIRPRGLMAASLDGSRFWKIAHRLQASMSAAEPSSPRPSDTLSTPLRRIITPEY